VLCAVMGCADPPIASDGRTWKRRAVDTLTVGCTGSEVTWKLTCVGNQWHGTYSNCTAGISMLHIVISYDFEPACSYLCLFCLFIMHGRRWLGSRMVIRAGLKRRRVWVQIAVATLSGNSLRQTVHTHRASVHQAAKLVAALLRLRG